MAQTVINRYYTIQIKTGFWHDLQETEYTEKEANRELRRLKECCRYPVRKKFLREQEDQILTVHVHRGI